MAAFGRGFQGCGTLPWSRTTTVCFTGRVMYQVSPVLASERSLCTTLVVLSTGVPYCTSNPPRRPPPPVALDSMADYTPFSGYARCESSALLLILVAICMSRVVYTSHPVSVPAPARHLPLVGSSMAGCTPPLVPWKRLSDPALLTSHANPMRCSSSGAGGDKGASGRTKQNSRIDTTNPGFAPPPD